MMEKLYLGIDIGGTAVKIGLINKLGEVIVSSSYSVNFDNYQTPILETVLNSTDIFLENYQIDIKNVSGIGVSATGGVDSKKGEIIGTAGHIKNYLGSKIKESFESKYHLHTVVLNDANAAAYGECFKGQAKDKKDVLVITIGTGVGGGIITNGKLLLGSKGLAGEVGHFSIDKNGNKCSCGNNGCFESLGSTTALVKMVKSANIKELENKEINGLLIFEEVQNGNQEVSTIVDEWIDNIACAIVGLVHIFNPELVLIGGGVSKQEEYFISPLKKKVLSKVMPHFAKDLDIKACKLTNDAGMIGAVYYLLNENL